MNNLNNIPQNYSPAKVLLTWDGWPISCFFPPGVMHWMTLNCWKNMVGIHLGFQGSYHGFCPMRFPKRTNLIFVFNSPQQITMTNPALAFSKAGGRSKLPEFDLGIPTSICNIKLSEQIKCAKLTRLRYGLETVLSIPQAVSHSFPGDIWTLLSCSHNPTNPPTQSQRKAQSHFAQALKLLMVEWHPFWRGSDVVTWQSSSRTLVDTSLDWREIAGYPFLYSPKIYAASIGMPTSNNHQKKYQTSSKY